MKKAFIVFALVCLAALPALAQNSWEIVRADYGSGNNWVDVTERVRSLVQGNRLTFVVNSANLAAEQRRGRNRVLRLQLQDSNGNDREMTFRENQQVRLRVFNTQQAGLHINRAVYAYGNRALDVTGRLNSQIQGEQLHMQVTNQNMGGDPAPGQSKTLTVNYVISGRNEQVVLREGDTLHLTNGNAQQGTLQIDRATYGSNFRNVDVTTRVSSQIQSNQLNLQVNSNSMGGDPAPGQAKRLTVDYAVNGQKKQIVVNDGDMLRLNTNTSPNLGSLQINRATYGSNFRNVDVTSRLSSQVYSNQLNLQVTSTSMGGDPAPDQAKRLTVDYAVNGQKNQIVVNDGDMLRLNTNNSLNNQSSLQIHRATYGSEYRTVDVTSRLNSQIQDGQLNLQVNSNSMGSDPAPGQSKTLTVQYAVNGQTNQTVVTDGDTLRLNSSTYAGNQPGTLLINRATYGSGYRSSDVTARLNSQVRSNQLNLLVTNATMGGDPAPNLAKSLTVQYAINGQTSQVVVNEGDTLRLGYGTTSGTVYGTNNQLSQRFNCESLQANGYGRTNCAANRNNEVRFVRQIGETQCTQNRTWGFDNNGVWVDQGCRAEFEVLGRARSLGSLNSGSSILISGTELSIRTNELIDSDKASVGQTFSAVVASDVLDSSGGVIIPRGADARLVIRSSNTGGVTTASELVLDVDSLTVNGTRYLISTGDLEQQGGQAVGANRKTAIMVGGGAALDARGNHPPSGGLGAEVLTRGKQVRVPAETLLNFRLDQDLRLQAGR